MPQFLLYAGFGLRGYQYQKTEYREGQIFFHVMRSRKRCARCQSWEVIQKGVKTRVLRTIPIGRKPVFAVIQRRRFFCETCGRTRYERLGVADPKRHYTHQMETYVMDLCMRMTVRDVAEHTRLHWATVKAIDRKRLRRNVPRDADLRKLRYIGVDEVSVRRGHRTQPRLRCDVV